MLPIGSNETAKDVGGWARERRVGGLFESGEQPLRIGLDLDQQSPAQGHRLSDQIDADREPESGIDAEREKSDKPPSFVIHARLFNQSV